MRYISTRGGEPVSAAQAIVRGICPLGGLYVPEVFPKVEYEELLAAQDSYQETVDSLTSDLEDIDSDELDLENLVDE